MLSVSVWRLLLCASVAAAVGEPAAAVRLDFSEAHMGTTFRIVLYASDELAGRRAAERAFARIAQLDDRLTDYRPTSELSRITRDAVGHPMRVSDDLLSVLIRSQDLA